jgi:sugar/nucleoside kinase (ribokinase family)
MANKPKETLQKFFDFLKRNRIPKAVLKGIPYIGGSLDELVYGGNLEQLVDEVTTQSNEQQRLILEKLEKIMDEFDDTSQAIAVIGGGNAEYLLILDQDINLGQKYVIDEAMELIGGGGVNTSARLLATCHEAYPILSIGNDGPGRMIRAGLGEIAHKARLPKRLLEFIASDDFFVQNLKTASTTILVQKAKRTAFTHTTDGNENSLSEFLLRRLRDVEINTGNAPGAIRISHINKFRNSQSPAAAGEVIKSIIEDYHNRSLLMVNLGTSQIRLGVNYWENLLGNVDIVQLNLHEAKALFMQEYPNPSLRQIVEWFRKREITVVITLSKFGAVGSYKNGKDGLIFAWPIETDTFVDSTGAGDAFSAGMVSELCKKPNFGFADFHSALNSAKFWATYACTTLGGAGDCPSMEKLVRFRSHLEREGCEPTEVFGQGYSDATLKLMDKAYPG